MERETSIDTPMNLGDLINLFYREFLAVYGDEELASVAAAATINELLAESSVANSPRNYPSEEVAA